MKNKSLELDLRQIMQGLEEFATLMSYQSSYEGLRILKVETPYQKDTIPDNVVPMEKVRNIRTHFSEALPVKHYN